MNFRYLQKKDYNLNYLNLLEQLTKVDKELISQNDFSNFIDTLNKNHENHQIVVMEIDHEIVATGTILIETN